MRDARGDREAGRGGSAGEPPQRDTEGVAGSDGLGGRAASAAPAARLRSHDRAVRAVADGGHVLALAASTARLCEAARRRHDAWPTAAAALGRALTAAALLALPLKQGGSVTVRIRGDGPIGGLLAVATPEGEVRGYPGNAHVDLPPRPDGKLDVGGAVGRRGVLTVSRDLGLRQPYSGSAPLVSGEIAEDLTHYLARSEQVPSLVALGVLVGRGGRVRAAGGLLVQLLPGAPPQLAARIEDNVARVGAVSRRIDEGGTPEDLAREALDGLAVRFVQHVPLRFRCRCGRRRVAAALAGLPTDEVRAMRLEDGGAEVVCRFCGRRYAFTAEDLLAVEQCADRGRGARRLR